LREFSDRTKRGLAPVKILWVKANKLLPLHSGGDIRSYHLAHYLATRHDLFFFSYYDGAPDKEYERRLEEQLPGAICYCTGKSESKFARLVDYAGRLSGSVPYAVSRFEDAGVKQILRGWYDEKKSDLVICDFLDAAVNLPAELSLPTCLFQHNVESEIWRRHAATEVNPAKKLFYELEFKKSAAYEKAAVRRFDRVIAVSEHDRDLMTAWVDGSRVSVIPTGVDLQEYKPDPSKPEPKPVVMFVGAMDWKPNIDAVEYFCAEIWPSVLAAVPEARFRIVGKNPDRRLQKFASESVEIAGRVSSVIDHLREAAVVVVPLRIGGGTRLKIYEAMAAGKAVVSTSIGAEGLDVYNGRDIVLEDRPDAFAQSVIKLLRERDLRRRVEESAAQRAARYDWAAVGERFEKVLFQLVAGNVAAGVERDTPRDDIEIVNARGR
jgi:glycosyltransferase involved in cell wall biosynthesis